MAIISGTFFTPKDLPGVPARDREPPAAHLLHEADPRDVMVLHHHIWSETEALAVVLAWGTIGLVFALRGFRWRPREG